MVIKRITYAELADVSENCEEEDYADMESYTITSEDIGDDIIVTSGPMYVLTNMQLAVVEGLYCAYDEDTGEHEPDWSLTLLYDTVADPENIDLNDYAYFEQDPPITTIHNYLCSCKSLYKEIQD